MGLKDELKKTIDNVSDAVNEAKHRGNAEVERAKRAAEGDTMTATEKAGSFLKEGKEKVLEGVDRAKRDVRENV